MVTQGVNIILDLRDLAKVVRRLRIATIALLVAVVLEGVALLWVAASSRASDAEIVDVIGEMVIMDYEATELLKSHQEFLIGLSKRVTDGGW